MKKLFTLILVSMFSFSVRAQHTPQAVTPGSKGTLPELSQLSPAREGELYILSLDYIYYDRAYSNSNEAWLSFPEPQSLGANGYIIQTRVHGTTEWQNTTRRISEDGVGCDITVYSGATDFRLYITGGEKSGFVSNAVTARLGTGPITVFHGWGEAEEMYKMVGNPIGETLDFSITVYGENTTSYDQDAGIYKYQWYRENPFNGDQTPIEGATGRTYTPVLEDCGYSMVLEVTGDGGHCNFTLPKKFGTVLLPVQAAIDYIGADGFVLSTDYVLPDGGKNLAMNDAYNGTTDWSFIPVPENAVSERRPGQYAVRLPLESYNGWEFNLSEHGYMLTFVYMKEWEEPPTPWYREVQVMAERYWAPLSIKAVCQSEPVPIAAVDIYGYNIDGGISFVRRVVPAEEAERTDSIGIIEDWENPSVNLYSNNRYFLKVIPSGEALASTYYPGTMLWEEAQGVTPGYDEDWNTVSVTVDVAQLPTVSGDGVVSGRITAWNESSSSRRRAEGTDDAEGETYSVLLKVKGGNVIRQIETDADGRYRFEAVPYGTYDVLVSVAGYTQMNPMEVTLDAASPMAEDIDYLLEDGAVVPDGIQEVQMAQSSVADCYDLSGRRLSSLGRGINIVRDVNGKTMKVIVK